MTIWRDRIRVSDKRRLRASIVIATMALLWAGVPAGSDLGEYEVTAAADPCLEVRFSPNAREQPFDCLAAGTRFKTLDAEGDWLAARLSDGRLGWLLAPCLELHSSPDEESSVLDCIAPSVSFETLETDGDRRAVRLADGRLGWFLGQAAVSRISPQAEAQAVEALETPAESSLAVVEPVVRTAAVSEQAAPVETDNEGAIPSPRPTAASQSDSPMPGPTYEVAEAAEPCLNVWPTPSTARAPLECIAPGIRVVVEETQGNWFGFYLRDGRKGWSIQTAFSLIADTEARSVQLHDAPAVPRVETDRGGVSTSSSTETSREATQGLPIFEVAAAIRPCLNVRPTPSTRFAPLDCLEPGTRVSVVDADQDWFAVLLSNGEVGWAIERALLPVGDPAVLENDPNSIAVVALSDQTEAARARRIAAKQERKAQRRARIAAIATRKKKDS